MSPHTYSIKFNNRSGVENTWAFFVKPPQLSTTSSVGGLYSNVWISSFVPDGGWFDITTTDQVYAWTGTAPQTIQPGVVVQSGDGAVATLGEGSTNSSDFPVTITEGVPVLGKDQKDNKDATSFQMHTDQSFTNNNTGNYLVGLGQMDNSGQIVPIATVVAQPNVSYQFTPHATYYVALDNSVQGTTVNINSGTTPFEIDFDSGPGVGKFTAIVSVDNRNSFTVKYE